MQTKPFERISLNFSRTMPVRTRNAREFRLSFRIDLEHVYDVIDAPSAETMAAADGRPNDDE